MPKPVCKEASTEGGLISLDLFKRAALCVVGSVAQPGDSHRLRLGYETWQSQLTDMRRKRAPDEFRASLPPGSPGRFAFILACGRTLKEHREQGPSNRAVERSNWK